MQQRCLPFRARAGQEDRAQLSAHRLSIRDLIGDRGEAGIIEQIGPPNHRTERLDL